MMSTESVDGMLNQAFHLAHYIYGDRQVAVLIVAAALADLEASAAAQDKRLYYTPSGRGARNGKSRTKISLSESHLLQRLVYVESEPYELQQERAADAPYLSEQIMIIRFIKHLVKTTLKRNSFYVTLGVNRLLFNYTTVETTEIYSVITQDPARAPDDDYCRKCKKLLMAELKERFGKLLEVCRGQRGEERFVTRQDSSSYIQLVKDALKRFTPWDTSCLVPPGFDASESEIARLAFYGEDPDGEHLVEIDRVHAVLHPDCHDRLLAGLKLDPADTRLAVPAFALTWSDDSPEPGVGGPLSNLSEDELKAIRDGLGQQSERRKKAHSGLLRILVDNQQRATLGPGHPGPVRFEVEESDDLIKIVTDDERGMVLMATYLISHDIFQEGSDPSRLAIVLEGGQEISFVLSPLRNDERGVQRASVEVAWKEQNWFWRIRAWLMRLTPDAIPSPSRSPLGMKSLAVGAAGAAIVIAVVALLVYFQFTGKETGEDLAKREEGVARTVAPTTPPSPSGSLPTNQKRERTQPREPKLLRSRTRGQSGIKTLLEVKRVVVIVESADGYQQPMQEALTHSLQTLDRLVVAASPKEANAALKVTVEKKTDSESLIYFARLVNVTGDRLWPKPSEEPGLKYEGATNEVANKIIKDLVNEIVHQEKQSR